MKTKLTLVSMMAIAVAIPAFADLKIGVLVPDLDQVAFLGRLAETQRNLQPQT